MGNSNSACNKIEVRITDTNRAEIVDVVSARLNQLEFVVLQIMHRNWLIILTGTINQLYIPGLLFQLVIQHGASCMQLQKWLADFVGVNL